MTAVRVVVVGHGMVGARFAEEVRRHDPEGRRVRVTVLGAEPRPAYNRVLLPNLLSGVMKEEDFTTTEVAGLPVIASQERRNGGVLHPDAPLSLRVGATVTGIDTKARTVLVEGAAALPSTRDRARRQHVGVASPAAEDRCVERVGYDILVLATGARPVIPSLPGLLADTSRAAADGHPHETDNHPATAARVPSQPEAAEASAGAGTGAGESGLEREAANRSVKRFCSDVTALHTLADARHVAAFAQASRRTGGRVAVLGGGVLGLEAARALAARGTTVTVVHRGGHLMDRLLDPVAGRVLAGALRRTGVTVSLGAGAVRWESRRGLWLADGELVRADGLVVCTGTTPHTELARAAGLRLTEGGAVAVDDTLATSVPDVYAIGDCAGHPGAAGGLVQPGWEQAAVLAARLTGVSPRGRYRGSGAVTRLKAAGIELTAVGAPGADDATAAETGEELEVLRFEDPARERYAKLVLSGGRVVSAALIGLPDAAAGIVQLYDSGAPAPADRLALLLGRALPPEACGVSGPGGLPDYAVVCRCNMVTKGQLRDAWYAGACGRAALSAATRAATGCGTCGDELDAMAQWLADTDPSRQQATDESATSSGQTAEKEPVLK